MLEMPQRSITRFFIPMIDVLTLMFCIYLLMPMVGSPGDPETESQRRSREERLKQLEAELNRQHSVPERVPAELLAEIERLRREKVEALRNRLAVRVLEIDGKDGKLSFRDPEPVELRDQADAVRLIERDRQQQGVSAKELYYLILYPRDRTSGYPTREQRQQYDRWFAGVALGYDVPGIAPGKER